MKKEELIKELELLADSCDSNYALEMNGYNRGVLDALNVVNKYFALDHVSGQVSCNTCKFLPPQYDDYCSGCINFARYELQETLH